MANTQSGRMLSETYEIRLEGDFKKIYRRLDSNMTRRVNEAIDKISNNPYLGVKVETEKVWRSLSVQGRSLSVDIRDRFKKQGMLPAKPVGTK